MSDVSDWPPDGEATSTAEHRLQMTLRMDFEEAVPFVQLEHELADFETVKVTRLDRMIDVTLGDEVPRTALLVVCHPEIARDALAICPTLAGMLPCTTVLHEPDGEPDRTHIYHVSATRAIRDLGLCPEDAHPEMKRLIEKTGRLMERVWGNIEEHGPAIPSE